MGEWFLDLLYYNRATVVEIGIVLVSGWTFILCIANAIATIKDRRVQKKSVPDPFAIRETGKALRTARGRAFLALVFLILGLIYMFIPARIPPVPTSLLATILLTMSVFVIAYMQIRDNSERELNIAHLLALRNQRESTVAGLIMLDRYNIIHQYNGAAAAIFGYPPDQVIGQQMNMLIPERYRESHLRGLARAYLNPDPSPRMGSVLYLPGLTASGEEVPLHIVLHETTGVSGRMFVAIFTVEKKIAEAVDPTLGKRILSETLLNTSITIEGKNAAERAYEHSNNVNEKIAETVRVATDVAENLKSLVERLETERVVRDAATELRDQVREDRQDARDVVSDRQDQEREDRQDTLNQEREDRQGVSNQEREDRQGIGHQEREDRQEVSRQEREDLQSPQDVVVVGDDPVSVKVVKEE